MLPCMLCALLYIWINCLPDPSWLIMLGISIGVILNIIFACWLVMEYKLLTQRNLLNQDWIMRRKMIGTFNREEYRLLSDAKKSFEGSKLQDKMNFTRSTAFE